MENKNVVIAGIAAVVVVIVAVAAYLITSKNKITSKNYDTGTGQKGGFWNSLFGNAANGVDSLGRNQVSTTAAFWNGIIGIIATSKRGATKAYWVPATYSDPGANEVYSTKINYGPYILGGIVIIAFAAYLIFKK